MLHSHDHSHSHVPVSSQQIGKAFKIGIILNILFVAIECIAGYYTHSIALLSDAGHNAGDVTTLLLTFVAFRLAVVTKAKNYTYGYRKLSVFISLLNAFMLVAVAIGLGYQAFLRISEPTPIPGLQVALVAFAGMIINTFSALLFRNVSSHDINLKGAYLHLAADALVSLGVIISGLLVSYTHFYWLDPAISLIITGVILVSSIKLLKESIRLSLDGVPCGVSIAHIEQQILKVGGVKNMHHIHVWPISTNQYALTAHVAFHENSDLQSIQNTLGKIRHQLIHLHISHATLEPEFGYCTSKDC